MPFGQVSQFISVGHVEEQVPLIYPAATNSMLYSSDFTNVAWTNSNVTVAANSTTAPNGATEADTLTNANAISTGFVLQDVTIPADTLNRVFSIWATAGTSDATVFNFGYFTGGPAKQLEVIVNLKTGAIIPSAPTGNVTGDTAGINSSVVINGVVWYQIFARLVNINFTKARLSILPALAAGSLTSAIVWNAQLETGSVPTGYIPTLGTAVTRVAGKLPSWILDTGSAPPATSSYSQQYFLASGNYTVPAGVTTIYVSGRGNGGGGGGTTDNSVFGGISGGSGAGATRVPITVTPTQVIAVVIPAAANGGVGGASATVGANGGNVTLGGTSLVLNGGIGGTVGDAGITANRAALGGAKTVTGTFDGFPSTLCTFEEGSAGTGGGEGGGLGGVAAVGFQVGGDAKANSGGGGGGAGISAAGSAGGKGGTGWMLIETF